MKSTEIAQETVDTSARNACYVADRVISWFSCGANSAIATKLAIQKYGLDRVEIIYCDTGGEHPDNMRFLMDCEEWFGKKITVLKNDKYEDHFDVWEKTGWINGIQGARCTTELKKVLRFQVQRVDDIQVFGYSIDEKHRADRFNKHQPEIITDFILIDNQMQKKDCLGLLQAAGIEIPAMYKLGFNNNNCVGCCKGGAGYWNHVRKVDPETFWKAARVERIVGHAILRIDGKPVFLDELPPDAGNHKTEQISCDFLCQIQADELTT